MLPSRCVCKISWYHSVREAGHWPCKFPVLLKCLPELRRASCHAIPAHVHPSPAEGSFTGHRLVGLVVKASDSRAVDLGSIPAFSVDTFPDRVIPVTEQLVFQWLPCKHLAKLGQRWNGWPCDSMLTGWDERSSHTCDWKIGVPVTTLQTLGEIGSALEWLALWQYADWVRWKFDLQLPSQCGSSYNDISRSVLEIY